MKKNEARKNRMGELGRYFARGRSAYLISASDMLSARRGFKHYSGAPGLKYCGGIIFGRSPETNMAKIPREIPDCALYRELRPQLGAKFTGRQPEITDVGAHKRRPRLTNNQTRVSK
jgi:hypothetical protein